MTKTFKQQIETSAASRVGNYLTGNYLPSNSSISIFTFIAFVALIVMCMYPEISFAAGSLESLSDDVAKVTNEKIAVIGIGAAAVLGAFYFIFSGNVKGVASIGACVIILGLIRIYINNGMKLLS